MSTQPVSTADKLPAPGSPEWLREIADDREPLAMMTPAGLRAAADRIEQAEAERDRLREANECLAAANERLVGVLIHAGAPEEPSGTSELAAWADGVLADRARLDWLERAPAFAAWKGQQRNTGAPIVDLHDIGDAEDQLGDVLSSGKTVREAIDAARKEAK
jgi:hypothetical protein